MTLRPNRAAIARFVRAYKGTCAYLLVVFLATSALVRAQVVSDSLNARIVNSVKITCVELSEQQQRVIELVDALSPLTPHIADETPAQRDRIDNLNSARLDARAKARKVLVAPKCLVDLSMDADGDGRADADKLPETPG